MSDTVVVWLLVAIVEMILGTAYALLWHWSQYERLHVAWALVMDAVLITLAVATLAPIVGKDVVIAIVFGLAFVFVPVVIGKLVFDIHTTRAADAEIERSINRRRGG